MIAVPVALDNPVRGWSHGNVPAADDRQHSATHSDIVRINYLTV